MSCLSFTNNYFDEAVVMAQVNFPRDIRNTYFKNSPQCCFGNLNLIYTRISKTELKKDCLLYSVMKSLFQGLFFDSRKRRNPGKSAPRELMRIMHH